MTFTNIYHVYYKDARNNTIHARMTEEEFKAFNEPTVYIILKQVWLSEEEELIGLITYDYLK